MRESCKKDNGNDYLATEVEEEVLIPGYLHTEFSTGDDGKLKYKFIHGADNYSGRCKDLYEIGLIYRDAIKEEMERAEAYIFERFLDSDVPAKAEAEIGPYWIH